MKFNIKGYNLISNLEKTLENLCSYDNDANIQFKRTVLKQKILLFKNSINPESYYDFDILDFNNLFGI